MSSLLFTLFLGFLLGLKHSFEADHVIAVSTISSEQKNPLKTLLVGTFWGLGHTFTLFVIGVIVLLLKISIPDKLSISLEGLVGIMLISLGIKSLIRTRTFHNHIHHHGKIEHEHFHYQNKKGSHSEHDISFLIGLIHGLAGSGALMLLVLSTIPTFLEGIYYILIFGVGSIIGMSLMSLIIGVPFLLFKDKLPKFELVLRYGAGILSICFGLLVTRETILGLFN